MKRKEVTAELRTERKKGHNRRLRSSGRIPAVVYGHQGPSSLSVDAVEFGAQVKSLSESGIVALKVGDDTRDVIIKDYQMDYITGKILHLDFLEIEKNKAFRTHVPVHIHGSAPGVREGGVLEHSLYDLEIECLPKDLPEEINVDISTLESGHSIHVSDLNIPDGVRVLTSEDQTVVSVTFQKVVEVEEEELEEGEEGAALGEEGEAAEEEEGSAEES